MVTQAYITQSGFPNLFLVHHSMCYIFIHVSAHWFHMNATNSVLFQTGSKSFITWIFLIWKQGRGPRRSSVFGRAAASCFFSLFGVGILFQKVSRLKVICLRAAQCRACLLVGLCCSIGYSVIFWLFPTP